MSQPVNMSIDKVIGIINKHQTQISLFVGELEKALIDRDKVITEKDKAIADLQAENRELKNKGGK